MLLADAFAMRENLGRYKTLVSQIRKSLSKFNTHEMSDVFDVNERDCVAVIDCIKSHPDWDNERIAEEIYWED